MHVMLADAGPAGAAIFFRLLLMGVLLAVVIVLLAVSWLKRSTVATLIAGVLVLVIGVLLQPWTLITPPPAGDTGDAQGLGQLRIAAVIWALFVVATAICLPRVMCRRKPKPGPRDPA